MAVNTKRRAAGRGPQGAERGVPPQAPARQPAEEEGSLVERVKAKDAQALEALSRRYCSRVYRQAIALVGNEAEAEEVVQEVFLTLYEKAKTFRGEAAFSTWLYPLATNAALTRLRRRKRTKEVSYEDYLPKYEPDGHHLGGAGSVVDWSQDTEKLLASKELHGILRQALDQLRPGDKAGVMQHGRASAVRDLLRDYGPASGLSDRVAGPRHRLGLRRPSPSLPGLRGLFKYIQENRPRHPLPALRKHPCRTGTPRAPVPPGADPERPPGSVGLSDAPRLPPRVKLRASLPSPTASNSQVKSRVFPSATISSWTRRPSTDGEIGSLCTHGRRRHTMKAIAVHPGKAGSIHLRDVPKPSIQDIPNGRGVLVKVLQVGVDGTDKEINAAEYGQAPPGADFLILGHESFGRVEAVGPKVTELRPGDYVAATVRRPGGGH